MSNNSNKTRRIVFILFAFVGLMFFVGYAMVPLYNVLCDVLGINGKTANTATQTLGVIDKSRTVTVTFIAHNNANLPWAFRPMTKKVELHPGQNIKLEYYAKNNSKQTMTVQAIPSVSPGYAAQYLKKTECFCFNQQTLAAGKSMQMPLIFHIDGNLPKKVNELTLSYTLFAVPEKLIRKDKAGSAPFRLKK